MKYVVWTKDGCEWCVKAKEELDKRNLSFEVVEWNTPELIEEFKSLGFRSFPQVFEINDDGKSTLIGGYQDLVTFLEEKELWD